MNGPLVRMLASDHVDSVLTLSVQNYHNAYVFESQLCSLTAKCAGSCHSKTILILKYLNPIYVGSSNGKGIPKLSLCIAV